MTHFLGLWEIPVIWNWMQRRLATPCIGFRWLWFNRSTKACKPEVSIVIYRHSYTDGASFEGLTVIPLTVISVSVFGLWFTTGIYAIALILNYIDLIALINSFWIIKLIIILFRILRRIINDIKYEGHFLPRYPFLDRAPFLRGLSRSRLP